MQQGIFFGIVFLFLYFIYKIGYITGQEDYLIAIENKVKKIRESRKEFGESWDKYYGEITLLELHKELKK